MTEPDDQPSTDLTVAADPIPPDDWAWTFINSYLGHDNKGNIGNITKALQAAGRSHDVYRVRKLREPTFAALIQQADQALLDALWSVTLKDAIEGIDRPIFQRGMLVGHVKETDWQTRRWLLERLDPERFHLPTRVELVSGDAPGAFTFQLGEDIDNAELEQGDDQ